MKMMKPCSTLNKGKSKVKSCQLPLQPVNYSTAAFTNTVTSHTLQNFPADTAGNQTFYDKEIGFYWLKSFLQVLALS